MDHRKRIRTVYVTFGQKYGYEVHPTLGSVVHPDGWMEIRGLTYSQARLVAFALTGGNHATDYTRPPDRDMFPRGAIITVTVEGVGAQ